MASIFRQKTLQMATAGPQVFAVRLGGTNLVLRQENLKTSARLKVQKMITSISDSLACTGGCSECGQELADQCHATGRGKEVDQEGSHNSTPPWNNPRSVSSLCQLFGCLHASETIAGLGAKIVTGETRNWLTIQICSPAHP